MWHNQDSGAKFFCVSVEYDTLFSHDPLFIVKGPTGVHTLENSDLKKEVRSFPNGTAKFKTIPRNMQMSRHAQ